MSLYSQLRARQEAGEPIRVGVIGAGKFASMYLAQARRTPGIQVLGIADLALERARAACRRIGWPDEGSDWTLEPGMVLCVARGVARHGYVGDFEETVVVTEDGARLITDARVRRW